jgi:predicted thioredoxin/glutaredoxin
VTDDLPLVTVYTRASCGLCRTAEAVVDEVANGCARVERVDIDTAPDLRARYTFRVPVVAVDGVELFDYRVDPEQLAAALARARVSRRGETGG